jgi:hypothetical protein
MTKTISYLNLIAISGLRYSSYFGMIVANI